jgi:glutathione peroxidase
MGFPSGDFNQELADNADIAEFCRTQYGVRFPMFAKTHVRGEGKIPLFRELVAQAGAGREIAWNYEKFLIDRRGKVAGRFATRTPPRSDEVVAAIEKALAGK